MMNTQLKGDWNRLTGILKEKYGELTDDDFKKAEGNAEELIGIIHNKTGKAVEVLTDEIEELDSKIL
ncbi:MAG: CsbD family protein [Bacteroidota bacterium]